MSQVNFAPPRGGGRGGPADLSDCKGTGWISSTDGRDWAVEFIAGKDALASAEIRAAWLKSLFFTTNLRAAQQTPQWLEYRRQLGGQISVAVVRDSLGEIAAIIPLQEEELSLKFNLGTRSLPGLALGGAMLIGSAPITSAVPKTGAAFFEFLRKATDFNAVFCVGLPLDTDFWSFLDQLKQKKNSGWLFYCPEPSCRYYWIQMPSSFEEYLREFNSKERNDVKRATKVMAARGAGKLKLERITSVQQIPAFLQAAGEIASKSWQKCLVGRKLGEPAARLELLASMAEQRILRSYLLTSGGIPCAFVVGFQTNGIFSYYETAYDERWAKLSPGRALLYLLLQDLFSHETPRVFYFGPGDMDYKRLFANRDGCEITLLILRSNLSNRLRIAAHQIFRSGVGLAKRLLPARPA
jgi:hypothetical protein